MRQSTLFSGVIFLFLVACSAQPVVFEALKPSTVKSSIIYVYRVSSLANAMISPKLLLNGKAVFELKNDSYQYNLVAPGKHIISLDLSEKYQGNKGIALDVGPNKVYFIRATSALRFEMNKPYTRSFNLDLVDSPIALHELANIAVERKSMSSFNMSEMPADSVSEKAEDSKFSIENTRNPFSK